MESGGIKLLNLKNQNEAIELVQLKDYLNFLNSQPTWAPVTDILINETTPAYLNEETRHNAFLQSGTFQLQGRRQENWE